MPAVIDDRQRRIAVAPATLRRAAARALAAVGRPASVIEIAVVSDDEIRRLNAAWRGVRRRTDVLAFPLETPGAAGDVLGQLVVSADAARRQARRLGVPLHRELALLVTHGTLHLVGWDDRDPVEADLMHRRERAILGPTPPRLWRGLIGRTVRRALRHRSSGRAEPRAAGAGRLRFEAASRHSLR